MVKLMSNVDQLEYYPMPDLEPVDLFGVEACIEQEASIKTESHQRCNQDSGEVEWYTPPWLLERVRRALGGEIDLDPASCSTANKNVQAKQFFTIEDDSLNRNWNGVVWMNHPYGKGEKACTKSKRTGEYKCKKNACKKRGYHIDHDVPGNTEWIKKYVNEFMVGNITKGACITFTSTSENWFRPLYNFWQVFLYDRVAFVDKHGKEGTQSPKGSVITFMGVSKDVLEREFADIGFVK